MSMIKLSSLMSVLCLLNACVSNPYEQFYRGPTNVMTQSDYIKRTGPVQIYSSENFEKDLGQMARQGIFVIGSSAFNAGSNSVTQKQLLAQAEKVGAHIVLVAAKNTGIISGAVPITLPSATTSQTTGSATVYGSGGFASAYGNAMTTTYGQQTVMMPYTVQRVDFTAVYLAPRRVKFGALLEVLDEASTKRLQTNQAVKITNVVDGSPAFRADIFPNDIITHIDGNPVAGAQWFSEYITNKAGSQVSVVLDREGQRIEKTVTLNSL